MISAGDIHVGDKITVAGRVWLPHLGVAARIPEEKRARFEVVDINRDNYGTSIGIKHESGMTELFITPEDMDRSFTRVQKTADWL